MVHDLDAFMATMLAQCRPVPVARVVDLVRERYGLEADAIRLTGERDENFKLTLREGAQYVLKVANPHESAAVADLQIAALLHLARTDAGLACPRVLRALDGATQVRFEDGAGTQRMARILSYLPGTVLGETDRSSGQRLACGRLGGRLARALRTFEHPAAHRPIIWDVRHVGYLAALLEELPGFGLRSGAIDLLGRVVPVVRARLPRMRQQVVHNDLNPRNILLDPTDETRVSGVIDFGDLTHTALIGDAAVACADLIPPDCTDPLGARESVLDVARGYHECMPLLHSECEILGGLVAARLLMSVVVREWYVRHNPSSRHVVALDPDFMRAQLELADRFVTEGVGL